MKRVEEMFDVSLEKSLENANQREIVVIENGLRTHDLKQNNPIFLKRAQTLRQSLRNNGIIAI